MTINFDIPRYKAGDIIINPFSKYMFLILEVEKINYKVYHWETDRVFNQAISTIDGGTHLLMENYEQA